MLSNYMSENNRYVKDNLPGALIKRWREVSDWHNNLNFNKF